MSLYISNKLKIWVLKPADNLSSDDDPWFPWFNVANKFIIRAETEEQAREIAQKNAIKEGTIQKRHNSPWLNSKYSTCVELSTTNEGLIILRETM